jgi:hypothetical protein
VTTLQKFYLARRRIEFLFARILTVKRSPADYAKNKHTFHFGVTKLRKRRIKTSESGMKRKYQKL